MKKLFFLFVIGLFATTITYGQQYDCGANSIFSQSLLNPPSAYISDEGGSAQYDNFYGLSENIGGMTFWGFMKSQTGDCYTPGPQEFTIKFFHENGDSVGGLVQTFDVTITPIETDSIYMYSGSQGVNVLRYEVSFFPSSVSLTDGWFTVIKKNPNGDECQFYFLNTTGSGDSKAYYALHNTLNTLHFTSNNRAFCLTGQPPVPVSNWALILGVFLIAVFMVVRYRRQMA